MVRVEGIEPPWTLSPADFRTSYDFRRPQHMWGLWSGLSLRLCVFRCRRRPSSLYTFPALTPGLARGCQMKGFPEFERFYSLRFPRGTQFSLSPLRLPFRHTRFVRSLLFRTVGG